MNCVVIGHGTSPLGKSWGPIIDRQDVVIRMWNCHWQEPNDWGVKYDYGFYNISASDLTRFNKLNQLTPIIGWVGFHMHDCGGRLPEPTFVVGNDGSSFTRGTRAAAWAMDSIMNKGDRLVLVGFDNVNCDAEPPDEILFPEVPDAYRISGTMKGARLLPRSHYAQEWVFLQSVAQRYGVNLCHAQDVWK